MDSGGLQGLGEFDNEVRLLSHLAHPHIVKLLGVCRQEGLRCLVYELMPCGNLEDRLACRVSSYGHQQPGCCVMVQDGVHLHWSGCMCKLLGHVQAGWAEVHGQ